MKAAIVVDHAVPVGLAANSAAVLGISLGAMHPEIIGHDIADRSGRVHAGITGLPVPILQATQAQLAEIVDRAVSAEALTTVSFTDIAQRCTTYAEYEERMGMAHPESIAYRAVLVVGDKRAVNQMVGSLKLYNG